MGGTLKFFRITYFKPVYVNQIIFDQLNVFSMKFSQSSSGQYTQKPG